MSEQTERGLLDLSVEQSTRDITAGQQFALYVLAKNPFDKPVWINKVDVSLPSELTLTKISHESERNRWIDRIQAPLFSTTKIDAKMQAKKDNEHLSQAKEAIQELRQYLQNVIKVKDLSKENTDQIFEDRAIFSLITRLNFLEEKIKILNNEKNNVAEIYFSEGSQIYNAKIVARYTKLVFGDQDLEEAAVDNIMEIVGDDREIDDLQKNGVEVYGMQIITPEAYEQELARSRTVELQSSLPRNASLQPGSTVVYTVILNVKKSVVFTPSKYRLQFNVNYSFQAPPKVTSEGDEYNEKRSIFANTIAQEISIRASIPSVWKGSLLGGFVGSLARLLQAAGSSDIGWRDFLFSALIAIFLAIILSSVTVVFMARKSDTQSIVSIEDFWGGILIGFFVGYTGTSFFENLTGIQPAPID